MTTDRLPLAPPHYIKPVVRVIFPRRYVYLDSEAHRSSLAEGVETQTFRLASAFQERYSERLGQWRSTPMQHFRDSIDLWAWFDKLAVAKEATVVWCHNLGYDLRITRALLDLPRLGWQFDQLHLGTDMAWAKARRLSDNSMVTFCDLHTWLPTSLEAIGREMGMEKVDLPDEDDSDEAWFERCDQDVELLASAWRRLRDWVYDNDLAPFRPTGSAVGWALLKHKFLPDKTVLCHDNEKLRAMERHAAYSGRCETYITELCHDVYEYDYQHAYVALCVGRALPTKLTSYELPSTWSPTQLDEVASQIGLRCLVTATVTQHDCALPTLPHRAPNGEGGTKVMWPTGTFTGVWWLEELLAAYNRGVEIDTIHQVVSYKAVPVLDTWAQWMIGVIENHPDLLVRRVAKQWARTVVGRFGMQYPVYVNANTNPRNDLWAGWWVDGESEEAARHAMQIGDQVFVEVGSTDGRDTAPAMMSYIMMLTRLRLLHAIETAGYENVIYCDTDGLLTTRNGSNRLEMQPIDGLRVKNSYKSVQALAPKQVLLDSTPRVSGLPARAQSRNKDGSYNVEVWERIGHALQEGRADSVRVEKASMYVTGRDGRRQPDKQQPGRTLPIQIASVATPPSKLWTVSY